MNTLEQIFNNIWIQRIFWTIVVIIISIVIYSIIARIVDRHSQKKAKLLTNKRGRTVVRMIKSITRYIIIILDILIILQIFGVDISSMLAAAGIASVILAFAIQDALKDIIRGFDIISDNYYNVGDVVRIGAIEGKVLTVGLKTTRLEDINTKNIVSIANRDITQTEVLSDIIDIDVPLPYELSLADAETVLDKAVKSINRHPEVTNTEYRKINNFSASSIDYRLKVYCDPVLRPQVRRDALRTIATVLAEHDVHIPYTQLDLHTKK